MKKVKVLDLEHVETEAMEKIRFDEVLVTNGKWVETDNKPDNFDFVNEIGNPYSGAFRLFITQTKGISECATIYRMMVRS